MNRIKTFLFLIKAFFKHAPILVFHNVPKEGDTLTVGNMVARFTCIDAAFQSKPVNAPQLSEVQKQLTRKPRAKIIKNAK